MRKSKSLAWIRPFIPVIIGLLLGFSMSLVRMPMNQESCKDATNEHIDRRLNSVNSMEIDDLEQQLDVGGNKLKSMHHMSAHELAPPIYDSFEEFEPRIITDPGLKPKIDLSVNKKKIVRTRFISTELGIREKMFAGIISSKQTINSLGVALNKTFAHHVQNMEFYISTTPGAVSAAKFPAHMAIQLLQTDPSHMMYEILLHIANRYSRVYDWFFIASDDVYIEAERLHELVNHISINRKLYMGYKMTASIDSRDISYCAIGNGILLSRILFINLQDHLRQCLNTLKNDSPDVWLGQCIFQTFGGAVKCTQHIDDQYYYSYRIMDNSFDAMHESSTAFQHAITVSNVKIPSMFYQLHHRFSQFEIDLAYNEIETLQKEIELINTKLPEQGKDDFWPIGINPPFKPTNRWDIIVWDYFTEEYTLSCPGEVPKCELSGIDKLDVHNILQIAIERLNEKYNPHNIVIEKKELVNGYRRFDPQRGMEYTLDLLLDAVVEGESEEIEISHRVHLLRPLSQVEIIPMPYVTESTKIHIILPITAEQKNNFDSFIQRFASVCFEGNEIVELSIVFVYDPVDAQRINVDDVFGDIKRILQEYESKYKKKKPSANSKLIPWVSIKTELPSQLKIMDVIAKKHVTNSLFLLTSVNAVLDAEFLNRCRMNTIEGWQSFFPVPFSQYNSEISLKGKAVPNDIEIKPNYGHFDLYSFDEACFYNSDYMAARTKLSDIITNGNGETISEDPMDSLDIYTLLVKYSDVHVFRAVEPQLKRRYSHKNCNQRSGSDLFQKCQRSNAEGLASRTQLAMELYPTEKKS